eukprot:g8836.t1
MTFRLGLRIRVQPSLLNYRTILSRRLPRRVACSAQSPRMTKRPSIESLSIWKTAQAVCFDVDSTLCQEESIDELADFLGVGTKVAQLTHQAMSGDIKFEDALKLRLSAMQPSKSDIDRFLNERPPQLTEGVPELVHTLLKNGRAVYLISGGFRNIINPIADALGIARSRVYANTLLFNTDGSYAGFDETEFTSRSGGKPNAVQYIKKIHSYDTVVMIGDGATDLEARMQGAVDLFIGYGGVVERQIIKEKSDWFIKDMHVLLHALNT